MCHGMNPGPGDGFLEQQRRRRQQQQQQPPKPQCPQRLLAVILWLQLALCLGPAQLTGGLDDPQACADPGVPENGFRTPRGGVFLEGSVSRYHCQDGFTLRGSSKRLCVKHLNGTLGWIPSDRSVCVQEDCRTPFIEDAEIHNRTYRHGDKLNITCHEGFKLRYPDLYNVASLCRDDGTWDNLPICQGCLRPLASSNGYVNISEFQTAFPVGTVIAYRCFPGFKLEGSAYLECLHNLIWSSSPPRCLALEVCPLPPVVSHGDFVCHPRPCDRYPHGTVVEFYCDPGYSLTSDYKYITCQYGAWFPAYQVFCVRSEQTWPGAHETLLTTWKIVAFTATSVLLVLLLVILARMFQTKFKGPLPRQGPPQELQQRPRLRGGGRRARNAAVLRRGGARRPECLRPRGPGPRGPGLPAARGRPEPPGLPGPRGHGRGPRGVRHPRRRRHRLRVFRAAPEPVPVPPGPGGRPPGFRQPGLGGRPRGGGGGLHQPGHRHRRRDPAHGRGPVAPPSVLLPPRWERNPAPEEGGRRRTERGGGAVSGSVCTETEPRRVSRTRQRVWDTDTRAVADLLPGACGSARTTGRPRDEGHPLVGRVLGIRTRSTHGPPDPVSHEHTSCVPAAPADSMSHCVNPLPPLPPTVPGFPEGLDGPRREVLVSWSGCRQSSSSTPPGGVPDGSRTTFLDLAV